MRSQLAIEREDAGEVIWIGTANGWGQFDVAGREHCQCVYSQSRTLESISESLVKTIVVCPLLIWLFKDMVNIVTEL